MFSVDQSLYDLSKQTESYDEFLSHDWETSRWSKFCAMLVIYNSRAAFLCTLLVSISVGIFRATGILPNQLWTQLCVLVVFPLVLCFWQRVCRIFGRSKVVFLDKLCIAQHDDELKLKGIFGLAGFLDRSQQLTIFWSYRYFSRLWCTYEVATFLKALKQKQKPILVIPVKLAVILCLFSAAELWMMGGFYLSAYVNLSDDTERDIGFGQLLRFFMFFATFYIPILPLLFYIGLGMMVELKELPEQLKDFRVQDAKCNKLHSIGVREEFKSHKDYQKYKRRYEDDLLHLIDKGIRECEDKDRLCDVCGLKYKLRFADINVRDTDGGKYKPDIHPECDLHKGYVKLREKQLEYEKIIKDRPPAENDDKEAWIEKLVVEPVKKMAEVEGGGHAVKTGSTLLDIPSCFLQSDDFRAGYRRQLPYTMKHKEDSGGSEILAVAVRHESRPKRGKAARLQDDRDGALLKLNDKRSTGKKKSLQRGRRSRKSKIDSYPSQHLWPTVFLVAMELESAFEGNATPSDEPYKTRCERAEVGVRPDPVVWGSSQVPLSEAQSKSRQSSDTLLRSCACKKHLETLANQEQLKVTDNCRLVTEANSTVLRSIFAIHEERSPLGELSRAKCLLDCVQQILDDDIYVHQKLVNLQAPFKGTGFSWHSDFETWHAEDGMPRPRSLSSVVFLDQNAEYNGALMVIPGSHRSFLRCPGRQTNQNWEKSLQSQARCQEQRPEHIAHRQRVERFERC
eukprot:Skav224203  [mRNA]  locus=scaffold939:767475:786201:- [translate_table: standard]